MNPPTLCRGASELSVHAPMLRERRCSKGKRGRVRTTKSSQQVVRGSKQSRVRPAPLVQELADSSTSSSPVPPVARGGGEAQDERVQRVHKQKTEGYCPTAQGRVETQMKQSNETA